jgi:hypothetical protein
MACTNGSGPIWPTIVGEARISCCVSGGTHGPQPVVLLFDSFCRSTWGLAWLYIARTFNLIESLYLGLVS